MYDELAHYNEAMEQSLADKLFFLDHFTADTVVDFGCANGALLKGIDQRRAGRWAQYPPVYFGIDNNEFQLAAAGGKFPSAIYATDYSLVEERVLSRPGTKAAIFSSVLHEAPGLLRQMPQGLFDFVVIRDMGITSWFSRLPMPDHMWVEVSRHPEWDAFYKAKDAALDREWDEDAVVDLNMGLLTEFLLKAPYLTDPTSKRFERELVEAYPLLGVEELMDVAGDDRLMAVTYFEHYSLPYIRDRIKRTFGFDFPYPTHFKLIIQKVPK